MWKDITSVAAVCLNRADLRELTACLLEALGEKPDCVILLNVSCVIICLLCTYMWCSSNYYSASNNCVCVPESITISSWCVSQRYLYETKQVCKPS
jgi:hypothetical protein